MIYHNILYSNILSLPALPETSSAYVGSVSYIYIYIYMCVYIYIYMFIYLFI